MTRFFAALIAIVMLQACSSLPSGEPSDGPFDISEYFDGRIYGYGIIERGNRVASRFDMVVEAKSDGDMLELDESFYFTNGEKFRRVWQLEREAPGVWVGGAENVKGQTTIKVIDGVVYMRYVAEFPNNGSMISLRFNQQLIPMEGDLILNRSKLTKFGVPVGTVTVIFTPENLKF